MGAAQSHLSRRGSQSQGASQSQESSQSQEASQSQSESYYPEDLKRFFLAVREGDRKSIRDNEMKIWDFIIYYIEWLELPNDTDVTTLHSIYQEYRQNLKDSYGSTGPEKYCQHLGWDIGQINERIKGNGGLEVHFCLVKAIQESFKSGEMPPKFGENLTQRCKQHLTSSREKVASAILEMVGFFQSLIDSHLEPVEEKHPTGQHNIEQEKNIVNTILFYLTWLQSPADNEALYATYEAFRKDNWESARFMYQFNLGVDVNNLKSRVKIAGGKLHHLELVNIIGEFLKWGQIPPAGQALQAKIQPLPYDTTLEAFRILPAQDMEKEVKAKLADMGLEGLTHCNPSTLESAVNSKLESVRQNCKAMKKQEKALMAGQAKIRILLEKRERKEGSKR